MCKIINPTQMFWVLLFSYPLIRCIKIKMQKKWSVVEDDIRPFTEPEILNLFFLRHVPSCFLTYDNRGSPRHMFGKFIMKLKEICRPPPFNPSRSTHDQRKVFFFNSFAQLYGYVSTSMFRGYTKLYLYDGRHGSASSFTDTDQR